MRRRVDPIRPVDPSGASRSAHAVRSAAAVVARLHPAAGGEGATAARRPAVQGSDHRGPQVPPAEERAEVGVQLQHAAHHPEATHRTAQGSAGDWRTSAESHQIRRVLRSARREVDASGGDAIAAMPSRPGGAR